MERAQAQGYGLLEDQNMFEEQVSGGVEGTAGNGNYPDLDLDSIV